MNLDPIYQYENIFFQYILQKIPVSNTTIQARGIKLNENTFIQTNDIKIR